MRSSFKKTDLFLMFLKLADFRQIFLKKFWNLTLLLLTLASVNLKGAIYSRCTHLSHWPEKGGRDCFFSRWYQRVFQPQSNKFCGSSRFFCTFYFNLESGNMAIFSFVAKQKESNTKNCAWLNTCQIMAKTCSRIVKSLPRLDSILVKT